MLSRLGAGVATALLAGAALGALGRLSDYYGPELRLLFALGAPWFLVAFGVGAALRRPLDGAAFGALALAFSVAVYYGLMLIVERRAGHGYASEMTLLWGVSAVPCGMLFGAAGAAAVSGRDTARSGALTLLGGTLAGEALLFLVLGRAGAAVLVCELALGAALMLLANRPPRTALLAVGASAAFLAAFADGLLRLLMRSRGWGG